SLLVNVPALIAIARGYLAQLRLDGPGTAEFAAQGMAEISDGEWILRSVAQGQLAVADWLGGRLAGAERAFTEGIAGRRAAGLAAMGEAVRAAPAPRGWSIPSRRSGRGCSWPRATWAGRHVGRKRLASAWTVSRSSPGSPDSWCWPGSCWRRAAPVRRSSCWT